MAMVLWKLNSDLQEEYRMETKDLLVAYYRLSVEDDNMDTESNSISNQRILVKQYISRHKELQTYNFSELYDDGYSGTTLERPAMQKLLELIKKQKVACIIVKDFSRFSRDYIDLGTYIQHIFPFMGIRFISIGDKFDSYLEQGRNVTIDNEFKSLLADFYCKDVSDKVKNVLQVKREKGLYSTGSVPFGYCKNPDNKYELLIVPEEAEIIREIFRLHSEGFNLTEICHRLNEQQIMTPLEFRNVRKKQNRKELQYGQRYWQQQTVYTILTNESYIGTMVFGKTKQKFVGSKKKILKPRNEWKRYENHHEPIISPEVFRKVQEDFFQRKNVDRREVKHMLKGKVYCSGCQRKLRIWGREGKKQAYYCEYAKNVNADDCYSGSFDREVLEQIIFEQILMEIHKRADREYVRKEANKKIANLVREKEKNRKEIEESIQNYGEQKLELYEQYRSGMMSRAEFLNGKEQMDCEIKQAEKSVEEITAYLEEFMVSQRQDGEELEDVLRVVGIERLDKKLVDAFVDRVIVYEDRNVEIKWKFGEG